MSGRMDKTAAGYKKDIMLTLTREIKLYAEWKFHKS